MVGSSLSCVDVPIAALLPDHSMLVEGSRSSSPEEVDSVAMTPSFHGDDTVKVILRFRAGMLGCKIDCVFQSP
jgi:hypothetical protein